MWRASRDSIRTLRLKPQRRQLTEASSLTSTMKAAKLLPSNKSTMCLSKTLVLSLSCNIARNHQLMTKSLFRVTITVATTRTTRQIMVNAMKRTTTLLGIRKKSWPIGCSRPGSQVWVRSHWRTGLKLLKKSLKTMQITMCDSKSSSLMILELMETT